MVGDHAPAIARAGRSPRAEGGFHGEEQVGLVGDAQKPVCLRAGAAMRTWVPVWSWDWPGR